ncbi:hypothetical protein WS91_23640 [Burkholderia sp. MSMB1498]|nr:hypothetical protein WS91_23640 [Burkholderia sp. MSMB1498]
MAGKAVVARLAGAMSAGATIGRAAAATAVAVAEGTDANRGFATSCIEKGSSATGLAMVRLIATGALTCAHGAADRFGFA